MTQQFAGLAASILCVALLWVALFHLNRAFFARIDHSQWAVWIFLPAAVRILSVLLLGWRGVAGLILGAWLTLRPDDATNVPHTIALPLSSGFGPWLAVKFWRRMSGLRNDLAGLRPSDMLGLAIGCAVANSTLVTLFLTLCGDSRQDVLQILTIVVGDIAGILLVLLPASLLLSMRGRTKHLH